MNINDIFERVNALCLDMLEVIPDHPEGSQERLTAEWCRETLQEVRDELKTLAQ